MSVYDHRCDGCQTCPDCGRSAWCEGDRILVIPCEHRGYCGDCNIEGCADCREEAEREMYRSGDYDPRADPFYRPEKAAEIAAEWPRKPLTFPGSSGFNPRTGDGS